MFTCDHDTVIFRRVSELKVFNAEIDMANQVRVEFIE
ncbi:hypothetical protein ACP4OV_026521 [Aristida adscensionis]